MFSEEQNPEPEKRNSGRTGPTSTAGREKSARNATRHGMCATTLIMLGEVEEDWLELLQTWLDGYQNPEENSLLYTFVLKTAQAEWHRLRVQREFDFHMLGHGLGPIAAWEPHEVKNHDLILRTSPPPNAASSANTASSNTTGKPITSHPNHSPNPNPLQSPCPNAATSIAKPANPWTTTATTTRPHPTGNPNPSSPASIRPTTPLANRGQGRNIAAGTNAPPAPVFISSLWHSAMAESSRTTCWRRLRGGDLAEVDEVRELMRLRGPHWHRCLTRQSRLFAVQFGRWGKRFARKIGDGGAEGFDGLALNGLASAVQV